MNRHETAKFSNLNELELPRYFSNLSTHWNHLESILKMLSSSWLAGSVGWSVVVPFTKVVASIPLHGV